jgi:hypothetical protein
MNYTIINLYFIYMKVNLYFIINSYNYIMCFLKGRINGERTDS